MRISRWVLITGLGLAAGCSSSPSRFYVLAPVATAGSEEAAPLSVMVGPVSVPAAIDRAEFVVQVAPNQVEIDEFNRWAAPLPDGIARAVVDDLVVLLGSPDVAAAPLANFDAAYRVTIDVQRFDSVRGSQTRLDAVWAVLSLTTSTSRAGRTSITESIDGAQTDPYQALAAAHSRAVARLSADIAAALRASAATDASQAAEGKKTPAAKKSSPRTAR